MQTKPDRSRQSRMMSMVEAGTNVVVGFVVALATQVVLFPVIGLAVSVGDNVLIGAVFTMVSIMRGYALRRLFESFDNRRRTAYPGANIRNAH